MRPLYPIPRRCHSSLKQEYIEAFLEVVKTKNITQAAQNLHLAQTTVSRYLRLMEEETGMQLVMRFKGHRQVELTKQGEDFVPLAENWTRLLRQIEDIKKEPTLELTIGAVDSLNYNILFPVLQQLMKKEPSLQIRICTDQSPQLYRLVENREIDVGFVSYGISDSNLICRPVFQEKMCLVRHRQWGSSFSRYVPSDFQAENEIFLNWGTDFQKWHDRCWNCHIYPRMITDSMLLLKRFLVLEDCWAVMPVIDLNEYTDREIEICDLGDQSPPYRTLYQIEPRYIKPHRREALSRFMYVLEEFIKNNDALQLCKGRAAENSR